MTSSVYGGSPLSAAARARFIEPREAIQMLAPADAGQSELLRLVNHAEEAAARSVTDAVDAETCHAAVLGRISDLSETLRSQK